MGRSHYLDSVAEFRRACDVPRLYEAPRMEQLAIVALRASLIQEEADEWHEALAAHTQDPTDLTLRHLSRELADVLYVTAGTADILGVNLVDPQPASLPVRLFEAVFSNEASRLIWELTNLGRMIYAREPEHDINDAVEALASDCQRLADNCFSTALLYDVPLRAVFDAVHASNMSKVNGTEPCNRRADGKVLKGLGYREADLSFVTLRAA